VKKFEYPLSALLAGLATAGLLWVLSPLQPVPHVPPREAGADRGGDEVILVAVGDMLLGNAARKRIRKHGYGFPFEQVAPLLADADLLSGNLEAPITRSDERLRPDKKWTYRQKPAVAKALRATGFDVLVLANNHAMDYGAVGLLDTIEAVEAAGIASLGAGADEPTARQGLVVEIGGVRLGLLAYQIPRTDYDWHGYFAKGDGPGVARLDRISIAADIARLRAVDAADVVVVQCHFGKNYTAALPSQERLARGIVDLGADAVIGHHSHSAQGVEVYRGVPILYSLGNFVFGTLGRFEEGQQGYGLVARLHIRTDGVQRVELDLIGTNNKIVKYQPTIIGVDEAVTVLEELAEPYGTRLRWEGSTAVVELRAATEASSSADSR
jgi:Bacterial capsule synthesis protein PGA_cap